MTANQVQATVAGNSSRLRGDAARLAIVCLVFGLVVLVSILAMTIGAAARTCQEGDEVIIASSRQCEIDDIIENKPRVLIFGPENEIIDRVVYDVFRRPDGEFDMAVRTVA